MLRLWRPRWITISHPLTPSQRNRTPTEKGPRRRPAGGGADGTAPVTAALGPVTDSTRVVRLSDMVSPRFRLLGVLETLPSGIMVIPVTRGRVARLERVEGARSLRGLPALTTCCRSRCHGSAGARVRGCAGAGVCGYAGVWGLGER